MKFNKVLIVVMVLALVGIAGIKSAYATFASPTPSACNNCSNTSTSTSTNTNTNININNNKNEQKQEQKQENNQTVNVTTTQEVVSGGGFVRAASKSAVPVKQPETGVGVLALTSLAGSGFAGIVLARFRKGKIAEKNQESLSEFANSISIKKQVK